jgi:hypothetical protein
MLAVKSLQTPVAPPVMSAGWYMATPVVSVVVESREVILLIVRTPVATPVAIRLPLAVLDTAAYSCGNAKLYRLDYIGLVASK